MPFTHSPEKENRSPQTKRREKHGKEIKTIHELLQVLANHSINISSQLAIQIQQPQPQPHQIHLLNTTKNDEDTQKLKIKLADYEFQLKKIGEDFAQFQLLAKMQKDKALRRVKEQLESERIKNLEDNSKWEKKFQQRKLEYEQWRQCYLSEVQEHFKKENTDIIRKSQIKLSETIEKLKIEYQQIVSNLEKTIETLKIDFNNKLYEQRQRHQLQIDNLNKYHLVILKEKEEDFNIKIITVQCQKHAEVKLIEQVKKESTKVQEKYLYQIGVIQREKKRLEVQADDFEMKYKVAHKKYQDCLKEIEELKVKYTEELEKMQIDRRNALENAKAIINQQKIQFLRDQYSKGEQLQLKFQKLSSLKQQMQKNYDSLLRTLQIRFQRRQSKHQDILAIRQYQQKLFHKQRQNSQIHHQLKMVQLQRENNDKIYTRIFTASKDKKSQSYKTDRDIYSLLKQSRTTDFRNLLKISQKQV